MSIIDGQLKVTSEKRKNKKERKKEVWKGRERGREGREGRELPTVDVNDRILEDLL